VSHAARSSAVPTCLPSTNTWGVVRAPGRARSTRGLVGQLGVGQARLAQDPLGPGAVHAARLGEEQDVRLRRAAHVLQHGVGVGDVEGVAGALLLDEHLLDDPVVDQHRVAPGAGAEAQLVLVHQHPHPLRELAVAVGHEGDAVGVLVRLPGVHHEGVVHRHAEDVVHPGRRELVGQHVVAGQVRAGAGGGEGAGEGEDHHLLVREQVLGRHRAPVALRVADAEVDVGDALTFTVLFHGSGFLLSVSGNLGCGSWFPRPPAAGQGPVDHAHRAGRCAGPPPPPGGRRAARASGAR
jgi:hypothetical protein